MGFEPDYIYNPELAEDLRKAKYINGTEFEIITRIPENLQITHAIFDHDGTISTLRQGWEVIMENTMIRAILGKKYETADKSLYHQVIGRVRDYINKSTGVQTIIQMRDLVKFVQEFGCVEEKDKLDEYGYKKIYNEQLLKIVRRRLDKLKKKDLSVEDFVIKGALKLLERLYNAGVKLYLASGTDEQDVIGEAKAMGYADLFEGGIYGSIGKPEKDAKKVVLERILNDIEVDAMRNLATFGDGPVEIRETHKRGGFAVGVASDEIRWFGLNPAKRSRLISAGADMIIPDYSQINMLLEILNVNM